MTLLSTSIAALSLTVATVGTAQQSSEIATEETVLFRADTLYRETANSPIVAEGGVEAYAGDQRLLADTLIYDPINDIVTAKGEVVVTTADGRSFYADQVDLTGDLKQGVATNFGALLGEQGRLVGAAVTRGANGVNTIERGTYTACEVCDEDGSATPPTWQVKAVRVIQDTNGQKIRFRHATFEAFGVPLFYTPYFEFPDPSVERVSGFLPPSLGTSSRTGFEIDIPYYFAISDHQDATFSPRYMTNLGTMMKGEYRVLSPKGGAVIQAGMISPEGVIRDPQTGLVLIESDLSGSEIDQLRALGDTTVGPRWHVFAEAATDLEDEWVASVDIDLVSDKNYLGTYDVAPDGALKEAVDILQPDRLENELAFTRDTADSFTDIRALMFQSLRPTEDNDFMADALPRITHERRYPFPGIGGTLTLGGQALVLHRPAGLDTARAIARASYEKTHLTAGGHRLRLFSEVRGDAYRYQDADQGLQECRDGAFVGGQFTTYEECREFLPNEGLVDAFSSTRYLPTAGVEWSYPLARFAQDVSIIIEPRAQLVIAPREDYTDDIFNEDSAFFQFDTVTLFDWIKSTGDDLWEEGQRINLGLSASAIYANGLSVGGSVGQQWRAQDSSQFLEDTGLGDTSSDIVGEVDVSFRDNFAAATQFRVDDEDGTLRRIETDIRGQRDRFAGTLNYLRVDNNDLLSQEERDEFLTAGVYYALSERLDLGGTWLENLNLSETIQQRLILRWADECLTWSLAYQYENREEDGLDEDHSLTFSVDLIGF
ncbi:hypothetical protein PB2503_08969 [Parvularcula bermudensis HTCC2503]|uniref:LPS-assembly protein LptD n=1 Tax=Parvularcula bermudensis (strain ATCC BAA-594 / HTCC2503 / KCTC 12087) TaxID=314260 RepID=E0TCF7_PARBH|nr:LPS assembly protein LptD [Parvularcula bermudensis]ADM09847.1 hypothetical protein PB2503_08969 [Parvularcula bermudensis HTCC2503]